MRHYPILPISIIVSLAVAIFGLQPALAQSPVCLQLMNELRAIDSGGGFMSRSPQAGEYERAIRDQRAQILKTEGAAQSNGCTGFNIFKRNSPVCGRITSSLKQMQANLRDLERNLGRLAPRAWRRS